MEGLLVVRDISRKRIRSLKKAVRPGNLYPLRVTSVDERMGRVSDGTLMVGGGELTQLLLSRWDFPSETWIQRTV